MLMVAFFQRMDAQCRKRSGVLPWSKLCSSAQLLAHGGVKGIGCVCLGQLAFIEEAAVQVCFTWSHTSVPFFFKVSVKCHLTSSESWKHSGWKRPLRPSSPTINPTPPCLLIHVLKCHIYTFFEHLQGWWLRHCPGQPVPMPDRSFSEDIFPNIQSKSPLKQLEAEQRWLQAGCSGCWCMCAFCVRNLWFCHAGSVFNAFECVIFTKLHSFWRDLKCAEGPMP